MLLPEISSGLSEAFRVDLARNDLRLIADQAAQQVAVHERAKQAANAILLTVIATDVPHRETLLVLQGQYDSQDTSEQPITRNSLVDAMVKSEDREHAGVSEKDITRDVLSQLHPDTLGTGDEDAATTEVFKTITEARQNEDATLTQGVYAGNVAKRASAIEHATATKLEKSRYKAWLALQAGKGRFDSVAEVEAWEEREKEVMPYKLRGGMLAQTISLYATALGVGEDSTVFIPNGYISTIDRGFKDGHKAVSHVLSDDVSAANLADVNLDGFDAKMGPLLEQLDALLELENDSQLQGPSSWTYQKSMLAREISNGLSSIAETLLGQTRMLGRVILDSFLGTIEPQQPPERIISDNYKTFDSILGEKITDSYVDLDLDNYKY